MVVLLIVAIGLAAMMAAGDPVLDFYVERADHAFESRDPVATGVTYSFRAHTFFKHVSRNGEINRIDSAVIEYYYSWGKLDSALAISGDADRFDDLDLSYPNVFAAEYQHNLFPNDTGGTEMGIGFDTDSDDDARPVGLALIDRDRYHLLWMYLSYPNKKGFRRFSRSLRFVEHEGRVFPDSLWVVAARDGVLFSEHYRIEVGITNITIGP